MNYNFLNRNNQNNELGKILEFLKKRKGLFIGLAIAVLILSAPTPGPVEFGDQIITLTAEGKAMIALLAIFGVIFATEALPMGLTVALVYAWIVFFGVLSPSEAGKLFSHDAAWFLVGALMMAQVLIKYNLHLRLLGIIMRITGGSTKKFIFGIVAFAGIIAAFIADHIIAAMLLPIGIAIVTMAGGYKKVPNLAKALMLAIAFGAAIGGLGAPSGGGRNVVIIGLLEEFFGVRIGYGAWMVMAFPLVLLLIPITAFLILRFFKPEINDLSVIVQKVRDEIRIKPMSKKEWAVLIIFSFIFLLWVTKSSLGIGMIALFGVLLFYIFGLAKWKDYEAINWGVPMLYFGAIGLGTALIKTGAASWLGVKFLVIINSILPIKSSLSFLLMQSGFMAFITQFMGDGPAVATVGPILLEATRFSGIDPVMAGMSIAISSAFAYMLVIGTPPNAIVYGSGFLKAKDFLKVGSILTIISLILLMLLITFWWSGILDVGVQGFH